MPPLRRWFLLLWYLANLLSFSYFLICGTSYLSINLGILIGTGQKLTLYPKRPYIRGPYRRALLYLEETKTWWNRTPRGNRHVDISIIHSGTSGFSKDTFHKCSTGRYCNCSAAYANIGQHVKLSENIWQNLWINLAPQTVLMVGFWFFEQHSLIIGQLIRLFQNRDARERSSYVRIWIALASP